MKSSSEDCTHCSEPYAQVSFGILSNKLVPETVLVVKEIIQYTGYSVLDKTPVITECRDILSKTKAPNLLLSVYTILKS